ncbi:MAG TPA: response regulator transcription factor [Baekduia sp.]|nr:response regulator transcription factor [Baekduia sp.]
MIDDMPGHDVRRTADRHDEVGVLIVDDQPFFRSAARDVIAALPGFHAVAEACSGLDAVAAVGQLHPELVLLDVRMPGMDGIEAARRIKAGHPRTVVVLISIEDIAGVPSTAHTCGAAALIRKQDFGPSVLRALWAAHGLSRH